MFHCSSNIFLPAGILKYTDLIESDSAILRILFATYMIIGNFFLLNLFLSVINDSLAYVQENPDEVSFDQELVDYLTVSFIIAVYAKTTWLNLTIV